MNETDVSSRVLANKSNIWLIGMKAMDTRIIKNYIHLVKDLNENFCLIDGEDSKAADIVFVNVESQEACNSYREYVKANKVKPIVVKCSSRETAERNRSHLIQPVTRHALESLLKKITSTHRTQFHKPKQDSLSSLHSTVNILVVDDSFPVRKYMEEKLPGLIQSVFKDLQINIDFASSGSESVQAIKKARGNYDVVFLDVVMQDVDGYKICKWIKNAKEDIQVIMLTSKNSTFDKVRGRIAGCNSYLSKPPADAELKAVLVNTIKEKVNEGQDFSYKLQAGN